MSAKPVPTLASSMSPFPYSVAPSATLREAREMMVAHDIHHLPVTDGETIVGVITDGDVFVAGSLARGASETLVDAIFSRDPYVVDIRERLDVVARNMAERRIGSAVVTRHGKLAGILTHTDVCRVLAALIESIDPIGESGSAA
ncbi:MAG: CBS domain-containing protein [Sandaracinaceae bacterium]|nr:CBS domain-containing protein [Sandaracinaceae bacterium]